MTTVAAGGPLLKCKTYRGGFFGISSRFALPLGNEPKVHRTLESQIVAGNAMKHSPENNLRGLIS